MDEKPNDFPNFAHGLVTFATPHAGAMIVNNTRQGAAGIANFISEGCKALAGAEIMPIVNSNFFTRLFSSYISGLLGSACTALSGTIVPYVAGMYVKPIANDYAVGAPFLTQGNANHPTGLSNYTLKVPVVQFYGEETQPILWKTLSSGLKLGEDQLDDDERTFGYDKDDSLEKVADVMISGFNAKYIAAQKNYNHWSNKSKKCWKEWWYCSPCIAGCMIDAASGMGKNRGNMDAYGKAIQWLSYANDYYLTSVVGSTKTCDTTDRFCLFQYTGTCNMFMGQPATYTSYLTQEPTNGTCQNWTSPQSFNYYYNPFVPCTGTRTVISTLYSLKNCRYKPSDGTVLAESAGAPIPVQVGNSHAIVLIPNTNHIQITNCDETRKALIKLYEGQAGLFFKVPPRQ